MKNLILPMLLIAPLLALTACHPHHHSDRDDSPPPSPVVPDGGLNWGTLNHFEHDFASRDIVSSGDQDGYEFFLPEDSVVVITTTGLGVDSFIDLYFDDFTFITGDDDGGPGADAVLVGTLSAGGYFAVVGGTGGSTGDYDVDISVEPLGGADFGEMIPGDSFIDNGATMDDAFDVDSFIFTIFGDDVVDIFMTTTSGVLDANLELLDEYGNVILFDDPAGGNDPFVIGELLTPGTYIVRIGTTSGSGDYSLQIDVN
jgi:hypothetical protein